MSAIDGFFTYTPALGLTFPLESPVPHTGEGKDQTLFPLAQLKIENEAGDVVDIRINAKVIDDIPETHIGNADGTMGASVEQGKTFTDGVWNFEYGADGAADEKSLSLTVSLTGGGSTILFPNEAGSSHDIIIDNKNYGSIIFGSDNKYSFIAGSEHTGQLNFVLSAIDSDGDTGSSKEFSITIREDGGPDIPYLGFGQQVKEAFLENGTEAKHNMTDALQYIHLPEKYTVDINSGGWVPHPEQANVYVLYGNAGGLVTDKSGSWLAYMVDHAMPKVNGENYVDVFSDITLLNAAGHAFQIPARIEIKDDAPLAEFGGDNGLALTYGKTFEGEWMGVFGADGPQNNTSTPMQIIISIGGKDHVFHVGIGEENGLDIEIGSVSYGRLVFLDNGKYLFTASRQATGID